MQKYKLPLLATGVLLVAGAIYFLFIRTPGVYQAVPASAIAVVEVKNWNELWAQLSTTGTGAELKKTGAFQKLGDEIFLLQELVSADKSLKEAMVSANTVASLHLTSATDYDFLFTTLLGGVSDNTLLNHVQSSPKVRSVSVHIFKNQKIVDVQLKDGRTVSFAKSKSLLAISFTTFLTENAMTAYSSGDNLASDKNFKKVRATLSAKGAINLYMNFQKAGVILPVALKADKIDLLQDISNAGGWARYEVSLTNDKMEWDGVISTLQEQKPDTKNLLAENLLAIVPDHAAYVELSKTAEPDNTPLAKYFSNWMGDTKALLILEPLKENFTEQNVLLVSIKNKPLAIAQLKKLAGANGGSSVAVDTFLNNEIYNLQDGSAINQVFKSSLVTFKNYFFTVAGNTAVFCNNIDVLKLLLEKANKGETLDKDPNFIQTGFSHYGMNTSLLYMNFERSDLMITGMVQENSSITSLLSSFKNVLSIANVKDDLIFSHLTFYSGGQGKASSGLVWKTKLKTATNYRPQMVVNNANEKEVFVQDTANNIYLIGQSGEIIFTKNIGEPILGTVQQLDYYNNGKWQYIFNSAQHVFVIDRLGYDVGSYPLRLSATATAGIAVVKSGPAYRYYVPCANGSIYGYESNGKPLPGWSPKSGTGILTGPLQAIATTKGDLLATFNTSGKLSVFDSRGGLKWSVENLPASNQDFFPIVQNSDYKLLNAAGNQLTEISGDGNDKIQPLIDSANAFAALATSDTSYSYYFSSGGQIRSYTNSGEFKGSANLAGSTISSLKLISASGTTYLLATDEAGKQLYIFDLTLKQIASFNYSNAIAFSVADLFNRNQFMVITADMNGNISCYRIK